MRGRQAFAPPPAKHFMETAMHKLESQGAVGCKTTVQKNTAADEVYQHALTLADRLEQVAQTMEDKFFRIMSPLTTGEDLGCPSAVLPPYFEDLRNVLSRIERASLAINSCIARAEI